MIAVPRRVLPTSPLSRATRWADSPHPDRKFPMPVFRVKCCQYWPWECHFFPAFSIFLFHSCYHCQSVENYRINVGEGLNLQNLLFVACCCRGGGRRDSAFCIQFVCILLEVIGLESSQSFTILALLCMCCRGLAFNDFLCSDLDCCLCLQIIFRNNAYPHLLPLLFLIFQFRIHTRSKALSILKREILIWVLRYLSFLR